MKTFPYNVKSSDLFGSYSEKEGLLDEVFSPSKGSYKLYEKLLSMFSIYSGQEFAILNDYAKKSFLARGITFTTYSNNPKGNERIFPFDLFPRIIPLSEWNLIEHGLIQRNKAINLFLFDIYHDKHILKDKKIPVDLILSCGNLNKYMDDFVPAGNIYNHISGTDIIKHNDGNYYVLEDNIRCPSGVSYVLANREAMKKTLSKIFSQFKIASVADYPEALLETMQSVRPNIDYNPVCVLLTPGIYNSAYYEHSFLAQSMGIELVEGRDLYIENDIVYMRTVYGARKVDVIYRRVDDEYLDPLVFRPDSTLGVPGLINSYRKGNVALLNAIGNGIADDKAVYVYVPEMIKYYLGEDPILNNVPTYRCDLQNELKYVLENIKNLVVKPVDQSGGYGILIGSQATNEEIELQKNKIHSNPRGFIAQPIMSLSVLSTFIEGQNEFQPRHIDLRTFTLLGKEKEYVLKGGLSRVALKSGSLIVNSSQGGGSKDTWVIESDEIN